MVTMGFYEEFAISVALGFCMMLKSRVKNTVQAAALDGTIAFLNDLLAGQVTIT